MKTTIILTFVFLFTLMGNRTGAQEINLENFDLRQIFGKVLTVDKGYSPKFYLGKRKIGSLQVVEKILGTKKNPEINRLFRTFKTGRTIYKIASYAGTAVTVYGTVKNIVYNSRDTAVADYKKDAALTAIYSGLGSIVSGVVVKMLTKKASYKAVEIFGGIIEKKIRDILSVDFGMIPQYNGTPGISAGIKIAL
jgi:hypothetical protein